MYTRVKIHHHHQDTSRPMSPPRQTAPCSFAVLPASAPRPSQPPIQVTEDQSFTVDSQVAFCVWLLLLSMMLLRSSCFCMESANHPFYFHCWGVCLDDVLSVSGHGVASTWGLLCIKVHWITSLHATHFSEHKFCDAQDNTHNSYNLVKALSPPSASRTQTTSSSCAQCESLSCWARESQEGNNRGHMAVTICQWINNP